MADEPTSVARGTDSDLPAEFTDREVRHSYHHATLGTDLAVIRRQAHERQKDNRHPDPTTIHFHRHGEPCLENEHEHYPVES